MWCSRQCLGTPATSDACLWHVNVVGGARCRGCAAAGVSEFFNGLPNAPRRGSAAALPRARDVVPRGCRALESSSELTSGAVVVRRLAAHGQQTLVPEPHHRDGVGEHRDVVARGEPVDRGERARVVAARDEHQRGRLVAVGAFEAGVDLGQALRLPGGHVGGGAERAAELPLDGVAGDEDHDDAVAGLVEAEQVHVGDRLTREEADAAQAELGRERVPGGRDEAEQLLTVRRALHEPGRLRGHERSGCLIDAQHGGHWLLAKVGDPEA